MPPIKGDNGASGIGIPFSSTYAAWGDAKSGLAVLGTSGGIIGVHGQSNMEGTIDPWTVGGVGVSGDCWAQNGVGVSGRGDPHKASTGVIGTGETGVAGYGPQYIGVSGTSDTGVGVEALSNTNIGLRARNGTNSYTALLGTRRYAAEFYGPVYVRDHLDKPGGGFLIDHPLDPANKTLHHSFVESPDRKNLYDGIAVLDPEGKGEVELPEWFSALNRDFRYQLTCIGGHAPVFVAQEIKDNRFRIAGGSSGLKVSWLVTGIRQDVWANANPLPSEQDKLEAERGSFLHPELYDQPEEKSLERARHPQIPELPKAELFERPR